MQDNIINSYPPIISQINEMKQIAKAEDAEFEKFYEYLKDAIANMFVSTANEKGLERFEKMLGIIPQGSQNPDERRAYILFVMNRRKMNLSELKSLIEDYAKDIELFPDYNRSELKVMAGECVTDLRTAYNMLDELLPLQVYIYFSMAIIVSAVFGVSLPEITLKSDICNTNIWKMKTALKTFFLITEKFDDAYVTEEKDLWTLDGTVCLDGGRILDAERKEEAL